MSEPREREKIKKSLAWWLGDQVNNEKQWGFRSEREVTVHYYQRGEGHKSIKFTIGTDYGGSKIHNLVMTFLQIIMRSELKTTTITRIWIIWLH